MKPFYLSDIPFVPTAGDALAHLAGLDIKPKLVIDLGCGDGRVLKKFKELFNCEVIGWEFDKQKAMEAAEELPGSILIGDMWDADVSAADVVYIYWMENLTEGFMREFWPQMKKGAWVISNAVPLPLTPTKQLGSLYCYQHG